MAWLSELKKKFHPATVYLRKKTRVNTVLNLCPGLVHKRVEVSSAFNGTCIFLLEAYMALFTFLKRIPDKMVRILIQLILAVINVFTGQVAWPLF